MLCDMCKKRDSIIRIQEIRLTGTVEMNLCEECARKKNITFDSKSKFPFNIENLVQVFHATQTKCPVCGCSLDTLKKEKKLGCPECYSVFKDEIKEILNEHDCDSVYTGSMPRSLESFRSVLTDRIAIKKKMDEAIKTEDYESAAKYRDFLKVLEKPAVFGLDFEESADG